MTLHAGSTDHLLIGSQGVVLVVVDSDLADTKFIYFNARHVAGGAAYTGVCGGLAFDLVLPSHEVL